MNTSDMEFAEKIGALAIQAILFEVTATPKPGLVDRNNNGAHKDMDFYTFMSSASGLHTAFDNFALRGIEDKDIDISMILGDIRKYGIEAEEKMFKMTQGVNTHKGIVFSIGLICTAAGYLKYKKELTAANICSTVAQICKGICNRELGMLTKKNKLTKGEKMYLEHGITGIRGEAESGFRTVMEISFPIFSSLMKDGFNINDSLVHTLIHLIANTNDTNIISRHDLKTAGYAKECGKKALNLGGMFTPEGREYILKMDEDFIERNISPGGCADLLAVTYLLYSIENLDK